MLPIATPSLQILSCYMSLVQAHQNVSSSLHLVDHQEIATWYVRSSEMLSQAGSAIGDMPGLTGDVLIDADADDIAQRLKTSCSKAMDAFSKLQVHAPWHPSSYRMPIDLKGQDDDMIMNKWVTLCDYVAEQAGVEPSYGIRTV